ncbi:MAG TPA: adenosylcobinamide-GDP ribazoletransferase [Campylobacterales bacterium]|nr:adenosylcobinamide-GDP ribazoletransferase [Campylobacterales bacterium]HHS92811.1 adenosylcobinamide-GDP ribazoletransferase [Campylobacterales bacterium]
MYKFYLGFKFAFSYFSVFPISFKSSDDLSEKEVLGAMLFFLPLVGFVLGIASLTLFYLLEERAWLAAIVAAMVYMMLYGFIHMEAVMDVADALYATHSGKDAYAIIKEPTVGAMGVLYALAFVLLKVAGVVYLLLDGYFMEFLAVLLVSRLSLLMLLKLHTFKSSFVTQLKASLNEYLLFSAFVLFSLLGWALSSYFLILLMVGLLLAYFISYFIKAKIGFVNGDVLGTTLESVEILLFLGIVAII